MNSAEQSMKLTILLFFINEREEYIREKNSKRLNFTIIFKRMGLLIGIKKDMFILIE